MKGHRFKSSMRACSRGRGRSIWYSVFIVPGSLPSINTIRSPRKSASAILFVTKDGTLFLFPDTRGFLLHEHAGLGVELPEGLVEQHDVRGVGVGAGDADALLHAARIENGTEEPFHDVEPAHAQPNRNADDEREDVAEEGFLHAGARMGAMIPPSGLGVERLSMKAVNTCEGEASSVSEMIPVLTTASQNTKKVTMFK